MWSRIFGRSLIPTSPAELVEHLANRGVSVVPHFHGDHLGWTRGELQLSRGSPVLIERYLTKDDELRHDLNAYAAELETQTYSANNVMLMERVIQTQQLITLRRPVDGPDEIALEELLNECCQYLSLQCDGVYQVDGCGWFAADGAMLLQEY